MPAKPATQPCEVCGGLTTLRCAACQKAGIDLFFCSRKHQKLVWELHKTVCGPGKAFPIAIEPLTDAELDMARRRLDQTMIPGQKNPQTLRDKLEDWGEQPCEVMREQIRGDVYDTSFLKHKPIMVIFVRGVVGQNMVPLGGIAHASLRYHVLDRDKPTYFDAFHARQGASEPWFSLLQHKSLPMERLSQLIVHKSTDEVVKVYVRDAKERFRNWVRSGMGTGYPHFVAVLSLFSMSAMPLPGL